MIDTFISILFPLVFQLLSPKYHEAKSCRAFKYHFYNATFQKPFLVIIFNEKVRCHFAMRFEQLYAVHEFKSQKPTG